MDSENKDSLHSSSNLPVKKETDLLKHSNNFTFSTIPYTEIQLNLLFLIIGNLQNEMTKDPNLKIYDKSNQRIISTIIDLSEISKKNRYRLIYEQALKFQDIKITYDDDDVEGQCVLAINVEHHKTKGLLQIDLHPRIVPIITYLGPGVGGTFYRKTTAITLRGKHTKQFYLLCCSWLNRQNTPTILVEEFRRQLHIPDDKYKTYSNFKLRVLDKVVSEVNEETDFLINYEEQKSGRKVSHLRFLVTRKQTIMSDHDDWMLPNGQVVAIKTSKKQRALITKVDDQNAVKLFLAENKLFYWITNNSKLANSLTYQFNVDGVIHSSRVGLYYILSTQQPSSLYYRTRKGMAPMFPNIHNLAQITSKLEDNLELKTLSHLEGNKIVDWAFSSEVKMWGIVLKENSSWEVAHYYIVSEKKKILARKKIPSSLELNFSESQNSEVKTISSELANKFKSN